MDFKRLIIILTKSGEFHNGEMYQKNWSRKKTLQRQEGI